MKIGHHGVGPARRTPTPGTCCRRRKRGSSLPRRAISRRSPDAPIVRRRLCLYCDTFDGDFWIDHDPERPGLVVAAGDSGHGFKFAPIIGGLIADVVEGRPNRWAERFRGGSGLGTHAKPQGRTRDEIAHP